VIICAARHVRAIRPAVRCGVRVSGGHRAAGGAGRASTLIGLLGLGDDDGELGAGIFLAIVCLLIAAGSGYGIYRAIRRLRR
jgi:hypothetical protein